MFLNHWLIARTGEEVVAREVFNRFKTFADSDAQLPMAALLEQIHRAPEVYRDFVTSSEARTGAIHRLALFGYRTSVLESEIIKPLVMFRRDPEQPPISDVQLAKALNSIESWMVRRMLMRLTTKSYNKVVSELIAVLQKSDRMSAGDTIEVFLRNQKGESQYWPDDNEVRNTLKVLPIYRRVSRARLRMVLEAIEDHRRGWRNGKTGMGGERVARSTYAIEHILPRKWVTHWPQLNGAQGEAEREGLIHTLGTLTLLGPLNSKVSNGPWLGQGGEWEALQNHDVSLLNRALGKAASEGWTHEHIRSRTDEMIQDVIEIWPVPTGHQSGHGPAKAKQHRRIDLADLLNAGVLTPGMTLYPGRKKYDGRTATLMADGRIDVDGTAFQRPASAAAAITGKATFGWWFFRVDKVAGRSLRDVLREYITNLSVDVEGEDEDASGAGE